MSDMTKYQHVGANAGTNYYLADPDIILAVPTAGFRDTPELARQT